MTNRSIIITGVAQNVGAACARRFADNGDRLILADRDEEKAHALADELINGGAEASFVVADVSKRLHVHNIIAEALEAYGRIDVLAHTAIHHFSQNFLDTSEEDFDDVIASNLRGAFLINQAVAKQFVKQAETGAGGDEPGAIVNVMSVDAVTAAADHVAFAASQGGVHQMTKAIALALSDIGVRANSVGIGAIKDTDGGEADHKSTVESVPLKRIGNPGEVADAVCFLASTGASYITGQSLYVDGGRMVRSNAPPRDPKKEI